MPADTCALCPHPLTSHGAGCTSGWFGDGEACHCPLDYDGQPAVACERVGCGAVALCVDRATFLCADHADLDRAFEFEAVPSWE